MDIPLDFVVFVIVNVGSFVAFLLYLGLSSARSDLQSTQQALQRAVDKQSSTERELRDMRFAVEREVRDLRILLARQAGRNR
jgi:hypothetical protein